jgi:hypothetical protein
LALLGAVFQTQFKEQTMCNRAYQQAATLTAILSDLNRIMGWVLTTELLKGDREEAVHVALSKAHACISYAADQIADLEAPFDE